MTGKLQFMDSNVVHRPLGPYSHAVVLPPGAGVVYLSGQIGMRPDGTVGSTIAEQADQAFANIVALLQEHDLGVADVVKLAVFIVAGNDADAVRDARLQHFGLCRPASTTLFVAQLLKPEWLIEVEAIAAR